MAGRQEMDRQRDGQKDEDKFKRVEEHLDTFFEVSQQFAIFPREQGTLLRMGGCESGINVDVIRPPRRWASSKADNYGINAARSDNWIQSEFDDGRTADKVSAKLIVASMLISQKTYSSSVT